MGRIGTTELLVILLIVSSMLPEKEDDKTIK